jgi:hypothetical protein
MRLARHLPALLAVLLAPAPAGAQARAGEWVSYRDAYRAMVVFEKYGGPKNLIHDDLQVLTKGGADGVQLTLAGKSTQLKLPLDAMGRTKLPLLKAAYDDNAVLVLNKDVPFQVRARVSIQIRRDGLYDVAELRQACQQALDYARYADRSMTGKQCAAVRLVFEKTAAPVVQLRASQGDRARLPVVAGAAFQGDGAADFATVTYRFTAERAQLITNQLPLTIVPLFE